MGFLLPLLSPSCACGQHKRRLSQQDLMFGLNEDGMELELEDDADAEAEGGGAAVGPTPTAR